ncbi:MAG: contact-dependent growth inhibition system immunity protein [Pseudomonadota bacterium]
MTLEQLTGYNPGDPADAETGMIEEICRAYKKPLKDLNDGELWLLGSQQDGLPYILDVIWPKLVQDPLHCFENYEGDLLSSLLRAPADLWAQRPEYEAELGALKDRALAAPDYVKDMFIESLI